MKKRLFSRPSPKRYRHSLRVQRLEDRTLLSGAAVTTFGANPQHTSDYQPTAQNLNVIKWQTPVDQDPQYSSGGELLIHYGAALATANNTILIPSKTGATGGFEISAFNGSTAAGVDPTPMYTLTTDYILPSSGWTPSYSPALSVSSSGTRLYYAGAGGTVYYISNPDSPTPGPVTQLAFYGLANYQASAANYNSTVFIDTPITADGNGDIFFGFRVQGTAPAPLNTSQSGYARIDANGNGSYVLAGNAAGDSNISWDNHNTAPALSNDGSTVYVVVKSAASWSNYGYLLALNSTTLKTQSEVFLKDPASGAGAGILDDSTASPMVGPDGDVFLGVMGNPYNGSRGYLLHFNSTLTQEYAPGAFGWDNTAAIVPASMDPSYTGTSSYLIFSKYNDYTGTGAGSLDGNGVNQVALLDPHAVETDPHNDGIAGLQVMREVFTADGPTADPGDISASTPDAAREWCINTAAVDPALDAVFFPSEDGNFYRWCFRNDQLMQAININSGIGQAYVPTVIGPDGTLYTVSNATLFAIGNQTSGETITITSSNQDLRGTVVGNSITFTARVTNLTGSGVVPSGSVTFTDTVTSAKGVKTTTTLGSVLLDTAGTATLTTSALAAQVPGGHFITAMYSGGGSFVAGQAEVVQFVHESGTTTALTVASNPSSYGQSVTFTATVTPTTSGFATPTGLVTFMDGTTFLGQVPLNSSAKATFSISSLAPGSHTITGIYESDPVYAMSTGTYSGNPLVVQEATSTAVSTSPNPSSAGQPVTLTATISPQNTGAGTPLGTVTFKLGSNVLASGVAVNSSGQASFTTSGLPVGNDTITATFAGATGWLTSSGDDSATPQAVGQGGTTTTVTASVGTSVLYQGVTFTATVTPTVSSADTPGGTVTFMDGSTTLGTGMLDGVSGNDTATFMISSLAAGTHSITAVYGADSSFTGSTSASLNQNVSSTPQLQSGVLAVPGTSVLATITMTPTLPGGAGAYSITVADKIGSTTTNLGSFAVPSGAIAVYGGPSTDAVLLSGTVYNDAFAGSTGAVSETAAANTAQATNFAITLNAVTGLTLTGAGGSDSLTGPNLANTWVMSGTNAGTLNGMTIFSGIANLNGGSVGDDFAFHKGGYLGGNLDAVATSTLDYSQYGSPVMVNLQTSKATAIVGTWQNIGVFIGTNTTDTLIGPNTTNAWAIKGTNAGTLNGMPFSGFANVTGGPANDTFSFQPGGSVAGKVNGGGGTGTDTLDYSAYGSAVTVNLATASAPALGTFSGIKSLLADSSFTNTLEAANVNNSWQLAGPSNGTVAGISFVSFETLVGGTAKDTFTIAAGAGFAGSIAGGGGMDTLVVSSTAGTNTSWTINPAGGGTVNGILFSAIASLTGGSGNDTFSFQPGGSMAGTITGGGGTDTLDYSAYGSAVTANLATYSATALGTFSGIKSLLGATSFTNTLQGSNFNNAWSVTGPSGGTVGAMSFSSFESLVGGTARDTFTIAAGAGFAGSIAGGGGIDTLVVGSTAGTNTGWTINAAGGGTVNGILFSAIASLTGGSGNDTFSIQPGGSVAGTITGGGGTDTLDYSAYGSAVTVNLANVSGIRSLLGESSFTNTLEGANNNNSWTVTGPNSGTVGSMSFSSFEILVGGTAKDTFTIAAGVGFAGSIAGGGGSGADTLVGQSTSGTAMSWVVNGTNAGTLNGVPFNGIANLTGGAGDDVFSFQPGGTMSGVVNGGNGNNWLDYSALSTGVSVNVGSSAYGGIPSSSATGIDGGQSGGVSSIKFIRGGTGDDTLVGGGGNILVGGGGNDTLVNNSAGTSAVSRALLIGGAGSDTLTAGAAGDLLIGGTTNYDGVNAALLAILTEWQSSVSASIRFSKLQSGVGAGNWQLIWGSTVQDDAASDTLNGGAGVDWFFAQLSSEAINAMPGVDYFDNALST